LEGIFEDLSKKMQVASDPEFKQLISSKLNEFTIIYDDLKKLIISVKDQNSSFDFEFKTEQDLLERLNNLLNN